MDIYNAKYIKELISRHGFRFSKAMGQNFLTAGWVAQSLAEESGIDSNFGVLEIGPGIGALTIQLCPLAAKVVSVELDGALLPILQETLADFDNVEIIPGNILKLDIPGLLREKFDGLRLAVCANLPYNITTPVLSALIDTGMFESITVMVQREVARRICAKAGTADYGAFTVYAAYHTHPEILFDVEPGCFMPPPKVHSSVITMKRREAPTEVKDKQLFFRVVRASFSQRRKTLVNSLSGTFGESLTKQELTDIVTSCGFDERVRGETLDILGFAAIAAAIGARLK